MSEDVWILGIHMTKFGKHPDQDTIDLASEAAMGALADGGITMRDMGILAAGNLMGGPGSIGQTLQKQIGQTGIPVYNVANACATGATALRTAIMVRRISFQVCCSSMTALGNMQPSQQICAKAWVRLPSLSRSHAPASRTTSSLPFGSVAWQ